MTEEEQRIAIAEACGWTKAQPFEGQDPASLWDDEGLHDMMQNAYPWVDPNGGSASELPDYLNDLNAMSLVEQTMGLGQLDQYENYLEQICERDGCGPPLIAPARARAEAFLKVQGLWTEAGYTIAEAYSMVLGGVSAISPELYAEALKQMAELVGVPNDENFREAVSEYGKTLPCDLD